MRQDGLLRRLASYVSARAVLVITALAGGLIILGLTAASAGVYDAVAEKDGIAGLDRPVLDQVIALRTPFVDQLFTWFTELGGPLRMTVIASAITLWLALLITAHQIFLALRIADVERRTLPSGTARPKR
jgi:undecaprenyl-diphosphatase